MAWTDSHCHIPCKDLGTSALDEARRAGVTRVVTVGTDAVQSAAALEVAEGHEGAWATVGLHPHEAKKGVETVEPLFRGQDKLVAVGECGLDYHYNFSPKEAQREAFAAQVSLARRLGLALVVHTREAWEDTFALLRSVGPPERTVFHCFTGGPAEARRALELGAWLSFSGIVTFRNAGEVREAAALCPLDRLLVETDSPYLAPVPHRGKPNSPKLLPLVGEAVAAAKGVPVGEVEQASWEAATAAFHLPATGPQATGPA